MLLYESRPLISQDRSAFKKIHHVLSSRALAFSVYLNDAKILHVELTRNAIAMHATAHSTKACARIRVQAENMTKKTTYDSSQTN